MSKNHRVNLRFDDSEIVSLVEKSGKKPLASFCREVVLGTRKPSRKKTTKYSNYPPELSRQLSAIGNNLNQIARLGHSAKKSSSLELIQLLDAIGIIQDDIAKLVKPDDS